jgi:hypothetical protein
MTTFRVGQRVRVTTASVNALADITGISAGGEWLDVVAYSRASNGTTQSTPILGIPVASVSSVRGKPFVAGIDARRGEERNPVASGGMREGFPASAPHASATPVVIQRDATDDDDTAVAGALAALQEALSKPRAASINPDEVREIVRAELDALDVADAISTLQGDASCMADDVRDMRTMLEAATTALASATPAVRARVRTSIGLPAASGNPIVDALDTFYAIGEDKGVNVLLCSPPSLGKSHAVRQFATKYDLFLEHGCSDDMDEIGTLLGSPIPDGAGAFVMVDGVLTQAVRAASMGQNVLLLLDETLRLSDRAQEWLLTFLTGFKRLDGSRGYRLRSRKVDASGALEVLECDAMRLHIVGATNLGMRSPHEAFWSRWHKARFAFDVGTATAIARAVLAANGVPDADNKLAKAWGTIVEESRRAVADGRIRFPADVRILERGAMLHADTKAVGAFIAASLPEQVAHWSADLGDILPESVAACENWTKMLRAV